MARWGCRLGVPLWPVKRTFTTDFEAEALAAVRRQTYGLDFGQNGWMTEEEFDRLVPWLGLSPASHVLEIASGSGGPAVHLARQTGCRVTGVDVNPDGIAAASTRAAQSPLADRVKFIHADANLALPFEPGSFDALVCIDSMNHLPDRLAVLCEWRRVLKPGGRALFTDPVVITGPVTNVELALRSSIGVFLFVPAGTNERLIDQAGLHLPRQEDVTQNAALVSGRWHRARAAHQEQLVRIEGAERFHGLQRFFQSVELLTSERRLSRIAYLVEKPA
jgi:SAM-dependent methyltransferase